MLATLASCVEDSPSASVQGVAVPTADCQYDPARAEEGNVLLRGALDFSEACGSPSYVAGLLVQSRLIERGNLVGEGTPVRADPNALRITGAEVELQDQAGRPLPFEAFDSGLVNPFSTATTVVVPSAEEDDFGQGVALVEIIPQAYVDAMREAVGPGPGGVIVASVKLFGETLGGVAVDVATFDYPISLCAGCMERCENSDVFQDYLDNNCWDHPGVNGDLCPLSRQLPQCAQFEDM